MFLLETLAGSEPILRLKVEQSPPTVQPSENSAILFSR